MSIFDENVLNGSITRVKNPKNNSAIENSYEWGFDDQNYRPSEESVKFWLWEKEFLSGLYEFKTPAFHLMMTDCVYAKGFRNKAIESYRGSAKSVTLSTKSVLYWAYLGSKPSYGEVRAIKFASATIDLIKGHMERLVETLESSKKLSAILEITKKNLGDYPRIDLYNKRLGRTIIISALTPKQKKRGSSVGMGDRGDILILDDVESEESVRSMEAIEEMKLWLTNEVSQSLKKGAEKIFIGTPLHEESLLNKNVNSPDVISIRIRGCRNFNPLSEPQLEDCAWKDGYPPKTIMEDYQEFKLHDNVLGFWQEIMLQLSNGDASLYNTNDLQWYSLRDQPTLLDIFVSVDASTGTTTSDDGSLNVVGVRPDGYWFVLDIIKGKFDTIELIDKIFELCDRYSGNLVLENGVIFRMLEPLINARMLETDIDIDIFSVSRNTVKATGRSGRGNGKLNVFKLFEPRVSSGRVFLPEELKDSEGLKALIVQMEGVTKSRILTEHDDTLDAIAQMELLGDVVIPYMTEDEYASQPAGGSEYSHNIIDHYRK